MNREILRVDAPLAPGWLIVLVVFLARAPAPARADDAPLTIADLAEYRVALKGKPLGTPEAVGFRDLWDHTQTYRGRLVQVEGRVVRRFRQGAVGTFPPLEEIWVVDPAGNPLCLVHPADDQERRLTLKPGGAVRFIGTLLKRVEYPGADGPRLAPLIVGARSPIPMVESLPVKSTADGLSALDWAVGSGVAALVVLVLTRQHLRRPVRPLRVEIPEPPPEFERPPTDEAVSA